MVAFWKSQVLRTNTQHQVPSSGILSPTGYGSKGSTPNTKNRKSKRYAKPTLEVYEEKMLAYFGLKTYQRGFMYMVENRMFDVETNVMDMGVLTIVELTGKCFGNTPVAYEIKVILNMDHENQPIHRTTCTCPVGKECKHAATLCFHYFQHFIKRNFPKKATTNSQATPQAALTESPSYDVLEHPLKSQLESVQHDMSKLKQENDKLREALQVNEHHLKVNRSQNTSQSLLTSLFNVDKVEKRVGNSQDVVHVASFVTDKESPELDASMDDDARLLESTIDACVANNNALLTTTPLRRHPHPRYSSLPATVRTPMKRSRKRRQRIKESSKKAKLQLIVDDDDDDVEDEDDPLLSFHAQPSKRKRR